MQSNNAITVDTYEKNVEAYIANTRRDVTGDNKDWLDRVADIVPAGGTILEIGCGTARDASYLEAKGYDVTCSDAAHGFVKLLQGGGHRAKLLNALTDNFDGTYNAILANMVFLHFTVEELVRTLGKVRTSLQPGGILAFSVRRGEGSEWATDKLGAPRYYTYWSHEDLHKLLADTQFKIHDLRDGDSTNPDKIYVIAQS